MACCETIPENIDIESNEPRIVKHRFYVSKSEAEEYRKKNPDDLWYWVNCILEREKIKAPNGVTVIRSTPYWNPRPLTFKKGKHHGVWITFIVHSYSEHQGLLT